MAASYICTCGNTHFHKRAQGKIENIECSVCHECGKWNKVNIRILYGKYAGRKGALVRHLPTTMCSLFIVEGYAHRVSLHMDQFISHEYG